MEWFDIARDTFGVCCEKYMPTFAVSIFRDMYDRDPALAKIWFMEMEGKMLAETRKEVASILKINVPIVLNE